MTDINRVGIDLAKTVFHDTAVDEAGAVVERKRFRRAGLHSYLTLLSPGCVVAMEACSSAHHWARLALHLGHKVLMMSPHKVERRTPTPTRTTSTTRTGSPRRRAVRACGSLG